MARTPVFAPRRRCRPRTAATSASKSAIRLPADVTLARFRSPPGSCVALRQFGHTLRKEPRPQVHGLLPAGVDAQPLVVRAGCGWSENTGGYSNVDQQAEVVVGRKGRRPHRCRRPLDLTQRARRVEQRVGTSGSSWDSKNRASPTTHPGSLEEVCRRRRRSGRPAVLPACQPETGVLMLVAGFLGEIRS